VDLGENNEVAELEVLQASKQRLDPLKLLLEEPKGLGLDNPAK